MNKLSLLISLVLIIGATTIFNQSIKDKIVKSITTGDIETLSTYFADDILLELFDKEEYENQIQIKDRLQVFFENHPPKNFKIKHEGGEKHKKYSYLIGILKTQEDSFRVNFTIQDDKVININITFEESLN